MRKKKPTKTILIIIFIFIILSLILGLIIYLKNFKVDISNNKNVNYSMGWINGESSYSGSEINFDLAKARNIEFNFETKSKATQGIEIFINEDKYLVSYPNENTQKFNVNLNKDKKYKIKLRHYCENFYDPCKIKLNNIYVNYNSIIIPTNPKNMTLSILGDSISTIYGNNNYSFLLSDKLGYKLHNASVLGSSLIRNKNNDDLEVRYEKDIKNFKSDKIIVFIGSNDAASNIPPSIFENEYSKMIKNIRSLEPNAKIYLVGILYRDDINKNIIDEYNNSINSVANQNSARYIDTRDMLLPNDLSDGIHPSKESQIKIADFLYANVK